MGILAMSEIDVLLETRSKIQKKVFAIDLLSQDLQEKENPLLWWEQKMLTAFIKESGRLRSQLYGIDSKIESRL